MDLGYRLIIITTYAPNPEAGLTGWYRIDYKKASGEEGTKDITHLYHVHKWIQEHCNYSVNCRVIWK